MLSDMPALDIIESFYLETRDGLFFAVKGLVHPPDRVIGVLRYVPDVERGERIKAGVAYRRLYHFPEQEQLLRSAFPQYLMHDPVFQITSQSVPKSLIHRIYDPRVRAHELCSANQSEIALADAASFIRVLQASADVPLSAIGISGSILIGMHRRSSDLDISIFGAQYCRKVYQALETLLQLESNPELKRFDANGIVDLYEQRVPDTRMAFGEFSELERNKTCQGSFKNRPYFIRFLKEPGEIEERYGDVLYATIGRATIEAGVADDRDAIFTPCRYVLSDARIIDGPEISVDEVVSFRGRFCEQARTGETITATGTVERVESTKGRIHHRLLLGNSPEDTMTKKKPA